MGLKEIKDLIIYPFATGMSLTQCFICLKSIRKNKNKIIVI